MATRRQQIKLIAPFKGLFTGNTPNIDPHYMRKCSNVIFNGSGCINKRPGFTLSDTTPPSLGPSIYIDGMFDYIKQGTIGKPVKSRIYHAGGNIYAVPNGAYLSNAIAVKTGLTAEKRVDHAILSDKYFSANGEDLLQCYDGSSMVAITPPGTGIIGTFTPSIIEVHRWSLWACGVPGNPSTLYKSVPLIGTDFNTNMGVFSVDDGYPLSGAAYIEVRPDDGTKITGFVGDYFGQAIIFKENSIHRLIGATKVDYTLPPTGIINGIGAIEGSVVVVNNDIYFASKKGIHRLSTVQEYGDNKEAYISLPIQEYYDGLDKFTMIPHCQSIHWPEISCVIWAFPVAGMSENNVMLVYNYAIQAWSIWDGINVRSFGIFPYDGMNTLFIGNYTSQISMANNGQRNDFGEAYSMEIEFSFDFGDRALSKGWRDATLIYNPISNNIETRYAVDNEVMGNKKTIRQNYGVQLDAFLLDTDRLASGGESTTSIFSINRSGQKLLLNIQNSLKDEDIEIQGVIVSAVSQGYRRPTDYRQSTITDLIVDNIYIEGGLYFGTDITEDGTWLLDDNNGNLDIDRMEDGSWVEKAKH